MLTTIGLIRSDSAATSKVAGTGAGGSVTVETGGGAAEGAAAAAWVEGGVA
ncbi:hypothetical protein SCE1572_34920 [Sorangium cellulosum So0157-2]|uniref:Uncharacterized protein n=1 Tax=Sorangium cellulosum So0157-2 TaxID=1254432 RepID=S4Y344_SORCE|nr:hypothetical protein SCE1572_34920 [Sorangium cellulosum So0157-2]